MAEGYTVGASKDRDLIKEQLGRHSEDVTPVFFLQPRKTIKVKQASVIFFKPVPGTAFVLGTARAELGTGAIGAGTYATGSRVKIINPDNEWREMLRNLSYTDSAGATISLIFNDTGNTTATWDTTNHRWTFTGSQIIQTTSIFLDGQTITKATLTILSTNITTVGNLTFQLSADGGSNWESVTLNTEHTFTNTGTDLRIKISSSGNAVVDIEDAGGTSTPITVSYVI